MKTQKIIGQAFFNNVGIGTWGIRTKEGVEYRPINMPEQLKDEDAWVTVWIQTIQEDASIHMWGVPVKIVSFSTTLK